MQNTDFFVDVMTFARQEPAGVRLQVTANPDGCPGFGVALLIPSYRGGTVEEWKRLDWWREQETGKPRTWATVQDAASAAADLRADVLEAPAFAVLPGCIAVVLAEGLNPGGLVLDGAGRPGAVVV